ncbi:tryptophan 2,3-dioxygenase family protein (plasmid) [Embleya sp. NBC_00888]|uniref:tryptophan 2,3-dioxygenase n=1 Tax=Embleya sp. NBC_00888 TaxID=2975960 RepID=UPI002F915A3A|nr:tryptophan 2,3-dioxygenase family protein [Embleya sp. NBC_00888]
MHRAGPDDLTYAQYLRLDVLLSAQRTRSKPEHHDELLFIIQHHTSELWLKLLVHELRQAIGSLSEDDLRTALKCLARVKHIQRQLFEQWAVLETLTPGEFAAFRNSLAKSSGFQSGQYRLVEFLLGNKNADMLEMFEEDPATQETLRETLHRPGLYDEFLRYLSRQGYKIPPELVERDFSQPYTENPKLLPVLKEIYEYPEDNWRAWETCEELIDIEEHFQLWRFRHMKAVERIIGFKRGTGGSSGVAFLRAALELTFFPELLTVRTEIGR